MRLLFFSVVIVFGVANAFFFSTSKTTVEVEEPFDENRLRGVPSYLMEKYDLFTCDGGKSLERQAVNDDFCDCQDGTDEPGTSACQAGVFHCVNRGYRIVKLQSSRVEDGICDCCDGSDEVKGKCPNICAAVASKEKAMLEKLTTSYKEGSIVRQEYIAKAKKEREELVNKLPEINDKVEEAETIVEELKEREEVEKQKHSTAVDETKAYTAEVARKLIGLDEVADNDIASFVVALSTALGFQDSDLDSHLSTYQGTEPNAPVASSEVDVDHTEDAVDYGDSYGEDAVDNDGQKEALDESGSETDDSAVQITGASKIDETSGVLDDEAASRLQSCPFPTSSNNLLVPLCKTFPPESLLDDTKKFLFYLLDDKKYFREFQLVVGYYRTQKGFDGIDTFLQSTALTDSPEAQVNTCPAIFSSHSEDLCGLDQKLKQLYEKLSAVENDRSAIDEAASQHSSAKMKLGELETTQEEASDAAEELQTYKDSLAYLAIKGDCFETIDGKFTYKLCMLDKITQSELGGGEVTLGSYKEFRVDEKTGGTIIHFDEGQHCWNFGARTADVHVTCGADNKLLTASEPSTCYYSFQLESPAACTLEYAEAHGLLQ